MAEIAINGEQARSRLEFLDRLELLCKGKDTDKILIHSSLEKNLWIFGIQYSIFSSNKTLKRQIEDYLGKKYTGKREKKRPDLMLSVNHANEYLLIKFKRPSHSLKHIDYQQVTGYRNDLYLSEIQKFRNSEIQKLEFCLLVANVVEIYPHLLIKSQIPVS